MSATQIVPGKAPLSPCVVTSRGVEPTLLNSVVTDVAVSPSALSLISVMRLPKLAAIKSPFRALLKFDALYCVIPLVENGNSASALLAGPGIWKFPWRESPDGTGDCGLLMLKVTVVVARAGSG